MPQTPTMYISHHRYTYKSKELMENSIPRCFSFATMYNSLFQNAWFLQLAIRMKVVCECFTRSATCFTQKVGHCVAQP